MATVTVEEILLRAQSILQDATGLRWPPHELMRWLNDAYREIVFLRPDAHAQVETLTCVAGARQDLRHEFPSALRLLDVVRLVPEDRRIAPRGVRSVEREMLDDIRPYWYGERQTHEIEHFCFDPRIPTQFLVYPPAAEGARLEVAFSSVPTAHDECPDLPDFCQPPCSPVAACNLKWENGYLTDNWTQEWVGGDANYEDVFRAKLLSAPDGADVTWRLVFNGEDVPVQSSGNIVEVRTPLGGAGNGELYATYMGVECGPILVDLFYGS